MIPTAFRIITGNIICLSMVSTWSGSWLKMLKFFRAASKDLVHWKNAVVGESIQIVILIAMEPILEVVNIMKNFISCIRATHVTKTRRTCVSNLLLSMMDSNGKITKNDKPVIVIFPMDILTILGIQVFGNLKGNTIQSNSGHSENQNRMRIIV